MTDQPIPFTPQPSPPDRAADDAAMDAIKDDSRIERYSRMSDKQISSDAAEAAESRKLAVQNIRNYCKRRQVGFSDLAKRAGLSASVVSEVIRNIYKGDVDVALAKIEAAIAADARREDAPVGGFVTTEVARQIFAVCRTAEKLGTMAVIYGESGIGKSLALQAAMQSQFRNGILVEINEECATPLKFLRALIAACGKRGHRDFWHRSEAFGHLVELLRDSGRLIAIDEADHLSDAMLDMLRQLHDATRCPIVLAGRPPLGRTINRTTRNDRIGASVIGRIPLRLAIDPSRFRGRGGGKWLFSVDEVADVLRQFKVRFHRSAAKWLCALANYSSLAGLSCESGGLRRAVLCFKMCVMIAKGDEITDKTTSSAYTLMDPENADVVSSAIDRIVKEMDGREAKTA